MSASLSASQVVAAAVRAALYAMRNPEPAANSAEMKLTPPEWEAMYLAQCGATDEWAARAKAAERAKAPSTLEVRIKELEQQLAAVNRRVGEANSTAALATLSAARAAKLALDDCDHPGCVGDRERHGYASCAGGHLARRVVKAILGSDKIPERAPA